MKVYSCLLLPLALDGGEWSASRPSRFTSGERVPRTHWMGSRTGFDVEKRKISPLPGLELEAHAP
jgi:hypothetical protein